MDIKDVSNPAAVGVEWRAEGATLQVVWLRGAGSLRLGIRADGQGKWSMMRVDNPAFAVPDGASAKDVRRLMTRFIEFMYDKS